MSLKSHVRDMQNLKKGMMKMFKLIELTFWRLIWHGT